MKVTRKVNVNHSVLMLVIWGLGDWNFQLCYSCATCWWILLQPTYQKVRCQHVYISSVHVLHITRPSHIVLRPTQPSVQWVPGPLSPDIDWPGHEAHYSPLSSFRVIGGCAVTLICHINLWYEYDKFTHFFRLLLRSRWELLLYLYISNQTVLCYVLTNFLLYTFSFDTFFLDFCEIDGPWSNFRLLHLYFDSSMRGSQILGAMLCGWLNYIWWCPVFSA